MRNKVLKWIYTWRKLLIPGAFLVLILISLIAWYSIEYTKTEVTPFSGSKVVSSQKKISDFDIEFYCTEYGEPDKDDKKKDLQFSVKLSNAAKLDTYTYTAVKCNTSIGDKHWTNRYKAGSSSTIISTWNESTTNTQTKTLTLSNNTYSYPVRKMLFVKIDAPTVWLNISYTKKSIDGSHTYERNYTIPYSYNEYFVKGTTIIN